MISNFSGVPLAFAFIIILGSNGVINVFLKNLGIEPFISIYANLGINLVYVCFQIPLAILLLLPAFKSLENSHLNACKTLGGGNFLLGKNSFTFTFSCFIRCFFNFVC
ncbi:hypothetical protein CAHE111092_02570 [Campylobacter hepaticus]